MDGGTNPDLSNLRQFPGGLSLLEPLPSVPLMPRYFVDFRATQLYHHGACWICNREIRKHGHASHAFAHERRGEVQAHLPPSYALMPRYTFTVTAKGKRVRAARLRRANYARKQSPPENLR